VCCAMRPLPCMAALLLAWLCAASAADTAKVVTVQKEFASRPTFIDPDTLKMLPSDVARSMIETNADAASIPPQPQALILRTIPQRDAADGTPVPVPMRMRFSQRVDVDPPNPPRFRASPTPVRGSGTLPSHSSLHARSSRPTKVDHSLESKRAEVDSEFTDDEDGEAAPMDPHARVTADAVYRHGLEEDKEPLRDKSRFRSERSTVSDFVDPAAERHAERLANEKGGEPEQFYSRDFNMVNRMAPSFRERRPDDGHEEEKDHGGPDNAQAMLALTPQPPIMGGTNYEQQSSDEGDEDYELTPAQLARETALAQQHQQQMSAARFQQTSTLPYGAGPSQSMPYSPRDEPQQFDGRPPSLGLFPPRDPTEMGRDDPLTDGAPGRPRSSDDNERESHGKPGGFGPRFRASRFEQRGGSSSSSRSRVLQSIMFARQQRAAQRRLANGRARLQDAQMNEPANPDSGEMMRSPMRNQAVPYNPPGMDGMEAAMDAQDGMPGVELPSMGMPMGAPGMMMNAMPAPGMGGPSPYAGVPGVGPDGLLPSGVAPFIPPSLDDTAEPMMLEEKAVVRQQDDEPLHRHHSAIPIADRIGDPMRFAERASSAVDSASAAFDGPSLPTNGGLNLAPTPRFISRIRDPSIPDQPAMEPPPPDPTQLQQAVQTPGGLPEERYSPPHAVL